MSIWQGLLQKLGLGKMTAPRNPIRICLLDDDTLRHDWFSRRFAGDYLDIAAEAPRAIELLAENHYDAVFLDHDLLPEHYESSALDDERTGYAVASWLAAHPAAQAGATVIVHTRNADGAMRMIAEMRRTGRQSEYVPFPLLEQKIRHYWRR